MGRRDRICVLTSCYPRREGDWAGLFVQTLAKELQKQFYVCVVAPDAREETNLLKDVVRFHYAPKRLQRLAYGSGILENISESPLKIFLLPAFLASFFLTAWRESRKATLIHSHWIVPSGLIGAVLHSLTGKPHLLTVHSGDIHLLKNSPLGRALLSFVVLRSSHIVTVSEYTRNLLLECLHPRIRRGVEWKLSVIPMPVTLASAGGSAETLKRKYGAGGKKVVVSIGRLIKVKGIIHLLTAVEKMADDFVVVLIAGEGMERKHLEYYTADRNLPVRFLGAADGKTKAELLSTADVFVLPSIILKSGRQEGLPVSLLEAIAAGVPVIASDVGGVREVVKDGLTGFLVRPADPDGLARKLALIIKEPAMRKKMGEMCRGEGKRFLARHVAAEYSRIIASL